jgi:hypothetical protein
VVDALEGLFRLHREADGDFGRPVENLQHVIAEQTAKLAGGRLATGEFNAPIAGTAIRTDDVGFFHVANMRSCRFRYCIMDGCDTPAT